VKASSPTGITEKVFYGLGSVVLILTILYFGKPVLLPIALGVLLAFILNPVVQILEKWRLGRIPAVLLTSGMAFLLILVATWALASQIHSLAGELPDHTSEIKRKIESFKTDKTSTLGRLTGMVQELFPSKPEKLVDEAAVKENATEDDNEITNNGPSGREIEGTQEPSDQKELPAPVYVVREPAAPPATLETAKSLLLPILEPLAIAALVVVLVIFLLVEREDVRYRAISLSGNAALTGTTRLMRDAAERVSRYLLYLFGINAAFGIWFGAGLYLMGVPYAPLWGFLTLFFRFIPFVGSPASVLFPLLINIATSSGWSQPLWVAVFFGVSELITANVIEPILFGKTTGLTPIALLVAVLFWTWIWGPIGLLLSTPLTVCLVVLGHHIPHLRSLKVLLAEQPVLDARLQYFQRLIAGDTTESARIFENYVGLKGRTQAFDDVVVPALRWARREKELNNITAVEESFIQQSTMEIVQQSSSGSTGQQIVPAELPIERNELNGEEIDQDRPKVYCHPVHHEFEELVQSMLKESQHNQAAPKTGR
jgi:predicted PurR-regulated permease PerM